MSRTRLIALAACAVGLPAAALAAPPQPTQVTIGATPAKVTFGKQVVVSGTTAANTAVTLRGDAFPYNNSFAQIAKATSNAAGAYSFTVTPDSSTHYRADVKKSKSPLASVLVRWKVTRSVSTKHPKRGSRVLFTGTVSPAHTGGTVKLQRRRSGVYRTIKTATLAAASPTSSSYSVRVRVRRSGLYRARVESDGAHEAGNSSRVKLTVH